MVSWLGVREARKSRSWTILSRARRITSGSSAGTTSRFLSPAECQPRTCRCPGPGSVFSSPDTRRVSRGDAGSLRRRDQQEQVAGALQGQGKAALPFPVQADDPLVFQRGKRFRFPGGSTSRQNAGAFFGPWRCRRGEPVPQRRSVAARKGRDPKGRSSPRARYETHWRQNRSLAKYRPGRPGHSRWEWWRRFCSRMCF